MWKLRLMLLAGVAFAAWLLASPEGGAADRAAVPPAADVEKAEALVKDLFKGDFAKTRPADRVALATKLLKQAVDTKDDPAARYVLLRDARDLAARGGDGMLAMRAADELADSFAVAPGEARTPIIEPLLAVSVSPAACRTTGEVFLLMADDCQAADDLPGAAALIRGAVTAGERGQSGALIAVARKRLKEVDAIIDEGERVKDEVAKLTTTPNDPAANHAVGRYLFAFKQNWEESLEYLAKGSDVKVKDAAQKDLKATVGNEDDFFAAADAWYDLAATADPVMKVACQIRAHHWYARALATATGLNKAKAEKRMGEVQKVVDERTDRTKLFSRIRQSVSANKVKKWQIVGGAFAKEEFEEGPPGGGILIGFRYTTVNKGQYPGALQAIYLTSRGEVDGAVWGRAATRPEVTKAKPGYAVGAIYVRGGGGFDQFKPIYMRMTAIGLNINDKYDGPVVGGMGGNEDTVGGDGNFIVGIHGKSGQNKKIEALSVITLAAEPAPPKNPRPRPKKR